MLNLSQLVIFFYFNAVIRMFSGMKILDSIEFLDNFFDPTNVMSNPGINPWNIFFATFLRPKAYNSDQLPGRYCHLTCLWVDIVAPRFL